MLEGERADTDIGELDQENLKEVIPKRGYVR
jgi:hypothetical protein